MLNYSKTSSYTHSLGINQWTKISRAYSNIKCTQINQRSLVKYSYYLMIRKSCEGLCKKSLLCNW